MPNHNHVDLNVLEQVERLLSGVRTTADRQSDDTITLGDDPTGTLREDHAVTPLPQRR